MLAGILLALVIAFHSIEGIDWESVKGEFENADWGWVVLAAVMYPLVPMSWATALLGCVNNDLPFVPTALTQLACTFLNLITPNGIGGTALQLDYLHKEGVPLASGGSAMVLSTGVGGAIQLILFFGAAAITATAVDTSSSSTDNTSLYVDRARRRRDRDRPRHPQDPRQGRARGEPVPPSDIWAVIRNPRKALQLIGGDLAGNLIYPAILGVCLLAFHQRLDFAQLIVVQVGAGMLGNVAPVPGGIGVHRSRAHRRAHQLRHPAGARARHACSCSAASPSRSRRSSASSPCATCGRRATPDPLRRRSVYGCCAGRRVSGCS